ncbi:CoA transferase subunit A [Radiobacillus sp. PE A8.2]|uniref:CoA transferase subunit A n=1 Tax=Radiobacillus sp. PE A8.2 TaxID=3380349 RepID=UPI00388F1B85
MNKRISLQDAVAIVQDGDTLALGGNVLHRAPMAFVRELTRQNKQNLQLVKTAGAHDIDLLVSLGCVEAVHAGFVSYETKYGLAKHYRKAVESGLVKANEHACYTVISALRAASTNVPFMPVHGLKVGDLIEHNDYFVVVEDPFGGEPVTLVRSIVPDVAVIHVQECDEKGNARITGPKYEDLLMTRAANKVIVTTEQIVSPSKTKLNRELIDIPGFLVDAVVHTPKGASPTSCYKKYDVDDRYLNEYLSLNDTDDIRNYVKKFERQDYAGERMSRTW